MVRYSLDGLKFYNEYKPGGDRDTHYKKVFGMKMKLPVCHTYNNKTGEITKTTTLAVSSIHKEEGKYIFNITDEFDNLCMTSTDNPSRPSYSIEEAVMKCRKMMGLF